MTASSFPPPPKVRESRFDDWMLRFYKAIDRDGPLAGGQWTVNGSDIYRSAGHVGIGAAPPSGQSASWPLLYLGSQGVIAANSIYAAASRAYFDGTNWKRISTGSPTAYNHGGASGAHVWYTSASGSAGATVSFLEKMRLDSDGKLGIGTSSPGGYLAITSGNAARAIQVTQSVTQAVNSNLYNEISVTETNADVGANLMNALRLNHTVTGTSTTGGRNSFEVLLTHSTPTASGNTLRYYCAAAFVSYSVGGDGGTSGNYKGAYYGINPVAVLGDGGSNDAEYVDNVTSVEANISVRTGSSVSYKAGIQIANMTDDAVQGTNYDGALSISTIGSGTNWKNGILFSAANGAFPLGSSSTIIKTQGSATLDYGVDVSSVQFNSYQWLGPGFGVKGTGKIEVNSAAITSDWAVTVYNSYNDAAAKGMQVKTKYGASTGTVFEATVDGRTDPSFRVDGDSADPIWITVNSSFRKVVVGASDSGGTGYRLLRVAN